jgi:hypothetical protein
VNLKPGKLRNAFDAGVGNAPRVEDQRQRDELQRLAERGKAVEARQHDEIKRKRRQINERISHKPTWAYAVELLLIPAETGKRADVIDARHQVARAAKVDGNCRKDLKALIYRVLLACIGLLLPTTAISAPRAVDQAIKIYEELNGMCRGWSGDDPHTNHVCEVCDAFSNFITEHLNYCYGKRGQSGAELTWHRCGRESLR